ncbi:Lrp/AsnC family transcriptional regulator [Streptomyces rochei]|uniref:Lrp/AsnC family transcriptional regulator n=1 Tax=Streptomyces rochei TaxID=1928 RepID=A0ABW7EAB2_STRRO
MRPTATRSRASARASRRSRRVTASPGHLRRAVGLSAAPCGRRIERMEKAGVICGYTAVINARHVRDDARPVAWGPSSCHRHGVRVIPGRRLAPANLYGADTDPVAGARVSPAPCGRPPVGIGEPFGVCPGSGAGAPREPAVTAAGFCAGSVCVFSAGTDLSSGATPGVLPTDRSAG